ncbi:MAG: hypothetical protein K9L25_09850 [Methylovulum sp.]|nr:hypothetical protein [Methylovulum sp.]
MSVALKPYGEIVPQSTMRYSNIQRRIRNDLGNFTEAMTTKTQQATT